MKVCVGLVWDLCGFVMLLHIFTRTGAGCTLIEFQEVLRTQKDWRHELKKRLGIGFD